MASAEAHRAIGWAAGVAAAALVFEAGAGYAQAALALATGRLGGVFPDRIEEAWWTRRRIMLIQHRTWTHIVVAWLALLGFSHYHLGATEWAPALFGLALGGVSHVLADLPNPQGVPLFWRKRYSLNLWKSGRADALVLAAWWGVAAWAVDQALLGGAGVAWARAKAFGWIG